MKILENISGRLVIVSFLLFFAAIPNVLSQAQQKIGFGVHVDPAITWFSSDISSVKNDGARPGFSFGLSYNKYFTPNYSFSTGINLINAGGRLVSKDTTVMEFTNFNSEVLPGNPVIYKIQYLSVPIGLKLQSNQIGYLTFFTDLGFDPKIVIGSKADIPSLDISGENAKNELNMFNLSYHVTAGIEYSLGGSTGLLLGLTFDNNFLDITKETGKQLTDKISHKIVSLRLGINF
jgi:hypothetical protein